MFAVYIAQTEVNLLFFHSCNRYFAHISFSLRANKGSKCVCAWCGVALLGIIVIVGEQKKSEKKLLTFYIEYGAQ